MGIIVQKSTRHDEDDDSWQEFKRTPLGDTIDKASMKMLKEAYDTKRNNNLITSPLSVIILLCMYSGGAEEDGIRKEIVKAMGVLNYEQLHNLGSSLSKKFTAMDPHYLALANKVYISRENKPGDVFSKKVESDYDGEIEKIDFNDPPSVVAAVNRWSSKKTKGHIKDAVSESDVDSRDSLVLVNVIFFRGHWHVPFDEKDTTEKIFHVNKNSTVKKPTMHLENPLLYFDSSKLGAKMIELPYKENGFRMVVVLPNKLDGLPSVMEKVSKKGLLSDIFSLKPADCDVILDIPKFELQSGLNLNEILHKIGVSKIFKEPATGIAIDPVVVSKIFQKAIIKVDEKGATAGAFTGGVLLRVSADAKPPPPIVFKVDHPFLFVILHEDIMLFAGTYTQ